MSLLKSWRRLNRSDPRNVCAKSSQVCVFVNFPRMRLWWVLLTQNDDNDFYSYFGRRKEILSTIKLYKWGIQAWEKWVGTALGCGRGCTFSPPLPFSPWDGISLSTVAWGVDILLIHYKVTCNDDLLFRGGYFLAAASSSQVCSAPSCLWVVLSHCCSPEHSPIF